MPQPTRNPQRSYLFAVLWLCPAIAIAQVADTPPNVEDTKGSKGFSGAGFGGFGNDGSFGISGHRTIESQSVLVAVSKSGRIVHGYSLATGTWDSVTVTADGDEKPTIVPIVSAGLACFISGDRAYAFSCDTGKWDVVAVEREQDEAVTPTLGHSLACFVAGTKAYAFGRPSGKWAVAQLPKKGVPSISFDWARIDVGDHIFMFSPTAGKWSSIDLAE